jgi:multiple sugar transport system permease protein
MSKYAIKKENGRLKKTLAVKTRKASSKILIYILLIAFALWIIVPFSIILSTSVKTWQESNSLDFTFFPKEGYDFSGYKEALEYRADMNDPMPTLLRGFLNTLLYVLPPTIIGLFTSAFAAYAFAKLKFKHKNLLFSLLIATMLVPGVITLVPTYLIYDKIGWIDTPLPLMIPGMFGAAACVFFLRQFYAAIPDAVIEAAKMDGMGHFQIFFRIMVPLSAPALIAQGILGFVGGYNDFFAPSIYLQSPKFYTLQIALRSFSGTMSLYVNIVMAGCVLVLVPVLLMYTFAQRYFIEGIATSGMKL